MESSQRPLTSCAARYLGHAVPQKTIQYPGIIHEPLAAIYSSTRIKRQDLLDKTSKRVHIRVINSGIAVEEHTSTNTTSWYPIQNLYCSAGVKPDKNKDGTIAFRELKEKVKSTSHALFAMVVREPDNDGRKVLVCHVFMIDSIADTQRLVESTRFAYQHKEGWGNPMADKVFLNAKLSYTLQNLEEDTNLAQLRIKTDEREQQLAQKPDIEVVQRSKKSQTQVRRSTVKTPVPMSRAMVVRSGTAAPRRSMVISEAPGNITRRSTLSGNRMPQQRVHSYYQGFSPEMMDDGYAQTQSEVGYPLSARPSSFIRPSSHQPSPVMNRQPNGFIHAPQSTRRYTRNSATPRGHRIIASSEPQELSNNISNGTGPAVIDWEMTFNDTEINGNDKPEKPSKNGDIKPDASSRKGRHSQMNGDVKSAGHSKKGKQPMHHRPSKKTMENYLHQNGDIHENGNGIHVEVSLSYMLSG